MSLALLFPGQGSQFVGMGKSLCEASPAARAVFDEADAVLGFSLSRICFEGPEEELRRTAMTQPAILTHSVAAWADLRARFPERLEGAAFAAGHSLGEYSANVAAGSLPFAPRRRAGARARPLHAGGGARGRRRDGRHRRARRRGRRRGVPGGGAKARSSRRPTTTRPSRPSSPGTPPPSPARREACLARGAKRAIPLQVSAPFHCALMSPARERMAPLLAEAPFSDAALPVVTNVDAEPETAGARLRDALVRQIDSPVRWVESVQRLAREGVDRALEIGPGNVLAGLVKRIERGIKVEGYAG